MYSTARTFGLIFGVPYILGYLMFFKPEYGFVKNVLFLSSGLSLISGALVPEKKLTKKIFSRPLLVLLLVGIIGCIYSMYLDITMINGADYPALFIRSIVFLVLFVFLQRITKEVWKENALDT